MAEDGRFSYFLDFSPEKHSKSTFQQAFVPAIPGHLFRNQPQNQTSFLVIGRFFPAALRKLRDNNKFPVSNPLLLYFQKTHYSVHIFHNTTNDCNLMPISVLRFFLESYTHLLHRFRTVENFGKNYCMFCHLCFKSPPNGTDA